MIELWTEKYRPKTLDDIVLPEDEKEQLRSAIKSGRIPHYLFIGPPGVGKTSLAKVIINELNALSLIINASEERGIDTIRDKVMRFVGIKTEKPKIVFLDEADSLTGEAQASLRNVMETYADNCRFILTGNYDKFIAPIKDRCEVIRFKQLSKNDCIGILRKIVVNENIELETGDEIDRIVDTFYPSIRKMISTLQKYSEPIKDDNDNVIGYKLNLPQLLNKETDTGVESIYEMFSSGKSIQEIREQIYEQGITDFIPVYRYFFKKFVENGDEISAILATEYAYRDTFSADKELNFVGFLLALKHKAIPYMIYNNVKQIVSKPNSEFSQPTNQNIQVQKQPTIPQPKPNLPEPKPEVNKQSQTQNVVQGEFPQPIPKPAQPKPLPSLPTPKKKPTLPNIGNMNKPKPKPNQNIQQLNSILKGSKPTNDFNSTVDELYNQIQGGE
jgi:replication factor C small subunit